MNEYLTKAIVLDVLPENEADALVILYTEKLGKVIAKAKGLKKITSKLASHLQPLNYSIVRLIEKNNFQIADALTISSFSKIKKNPEELLKFIKVINFIESISFPYHNDQKFFLSFLKILNSSLSLEQIFYFLLKEAGFDPENAKCHFCYHQIKYFSKEEGIFICQKCAGKIEKNKLILIKSLSKTYEIQKMVNR